ncbi:MAG: DUF3226 domain-containing protein [Polyangiaceae bacterium]
MKAVFVFCEGNHDVAFVARSLGQVAGATWVDEPIGELPSPLGPIRDPANRNKPKVESLIARRYSNRTLDALKLREAAHAPPPAFDAIVKTTDTLYVLIRCHGDGAARSAIDLVADVNALLNPAFGADIKEIASAFLFDADASLAQRELRFASEYEPLLQGAPAPAHGTWIQGPPRVGLYVFHDQTTQRGTLEELLAPLVAAEWNARWQAADAYLTSHAEADDPVTVKPAERLKAQITVTGQVRTPGDPMTTVLFHRRWGLPGAHFNGPDSRSLVQFLRGAPW